MLTPIQYWGVAGLCKGIAAQSFATNTAEGELAAQLQADLPLLRQIFPVLDFSRIQKAHAVDCSPVAAVLLGIVKGLVRLLKDIIWSNPLNIVNKAATHAYCNRKLLVLLVKNNILYCKAYALCN